MIQKHKLRYTSFIADGESSTYPTLKENSYGNEHPIAKHEYLVHVQKRMTNHINVLKNKVNKDESGNMMKIRGRRCRTAEKTKLFQQYYGKAIHSNTNDAVGMKEAVMDIFHYSASTDTLNITCAQ